MSTRLVVAVMALVALLTVPSAVSAATITRVVDGDRWFLIEIELGRLLVVVLLLFLLVAVLLEEVGPVVDQLAGTLHGPRPPRRRIVQHDPTRVDVEDEVSASGDLVEVEDSPAG